MLGIIIMGGFTFFMYLIIETFIFERERGIPVNISQLNEHDYAGLWQEIASKLEVDEQAKLEDFHLFYTQQGEVQKLSYEIVGRSKDDFIYYYVDYDIAHRKAIVKRHKLNGPWTQYDRSIAARYFFERLDEMDLTALKPNSDDPIRQMQVNESGTRINYAIKDMKKYRLDKDQIREISNAELPIEGYWLSVCGMMGEAAPDFISSCEDRIDYFLDAE